MPSARTADRGPSETELHCCLERDGCGEQPSVALTLNIYEQARTLEMPARPFAYACVFKKKYIYIYIYTYCYIYMQHGVVPVTVVAGAQGVMHQALHIPLSGECQLQIQDSTATTASVVSTSKRNIYILESALSTLPKPCSNPAFLAEACSSRQTSYRQQQLGTSDSVSADLFL